MEGRQFDSKLHSRSPEVQQRILACSPMQCGTTLRSSSSRRTGRGRHASARRDLRVGPDRRAGQVLTANAGGTPGGVRGRTSSRPARSSLRQGPRRSRGVPPGVNAAVEETVARFLRQAVDWPEPPAWLKCGAVLLPVSLRALSGARSFRGLAQQAVQGLRRNFRFGL